MTTFNSATIGHTVATAASAILVGAACIAGAIAPAQAGAADRPIDKAEWTQKVANSLATHVRPTTVLPDFILANQIAVVGAHFDADGKFTGVSMEQPTQYRSLDREAIRATRTLAYPMLPTALRGIPRVIALRVVFSNNVDPSALARTDQVANRVASRYASMGNQIAGR